jgi:hypothetical protein
VVTTTYRVGFSAFSISQNNFSREHLVHQSRDDDIDGTDDVRMGVDSKDIT